MTTDLWVFVSVAAIAIATGIGMLASRNAVYSTLFLVMNFVTMAVLYLLLDAAFVAMVQVTVYAGAIMVLFLFVVMLLGAERSAGGDTLKWQRPTAILLGVALLAEGIYAIFTATGGDLPEASVSPGFGSPAAVGEALFSVYLLPIEVASILLLVSMVGAIVLTRNSRKRGP